jgi:hypothetical protein
MGSGRIVPAAFSEAFREINLLAQRRDVVAMTIRGIYAAIGISVPPCERGRCIEIAREMTSSLKDMGESRFAATVEASLRSARPQIMSTSISVRSMSRHDQLPFRQTARVFTPRPPAGPSILRSLARAIRLVQ